MNDLDGTAPGAVMQVLEEAYRLAQQGDIRHICMTMASYKTGHVIHAGDMHMEEKSVKLVAALYDTLDAAVVNKTPPEPDVSLGADWACYNCARGVFGYDFLTWLIDAEMTRLREGAPAPLKVGFWYGRDGKTRSGAMGFVPDPAANNLRLDGIFDHIMRAALALVGAVEHPHAVHARCKEIFVPKDIVTAVKAGETLPTLTPSTVATHAVRQFLAGRAPVTITLREASHAPQRNSNLDAWEKFAEDLRASGEIALIVRDTAFADEPFGVFKTCPEAARDLHVRAALYRAAKTNFFVANGPGALAHFLDVPFVQFIDVDSNDVTHPVHGPQFWDEGMGIRPGAQFPWFRPDQRIFWGLDSYDNIAGAWASHRRIIAERKAA